MDVHNAHLNELGQLLRGRPIMDSVICHVSLFICIIGVIIPKMPKAEFFEIIDRERANARWDRNGMDGNNQPCNLDSHSTPVYSAHGVQNTMQGYPFDSAGQ